MRMPTLVVFQLGGEHCAIRASEVQEIVLMASLARPPGLPSILEGFLNLRGAATPVVRLDRLFGLPRGPSGLYTPLLILRGRPDPLALLAERIDNVVSASDSDLKPVLAGHCFSDWTESEIWLEPDRAPIHLLSRERLLLAQEQSRVAELRAIAQQHLQELESGS
jgi:purine-binding chemotaxis protein CheW